jgi:hypothetical protein
MLTSTRRGISYPNPARTDAADVPAHILNLVNALEVDVVYGQGAIGARPVSTPGTPGMAGRIYYVDSGPTLGDLWYDFGTGWRLIGKVLPDPVIWTSAAGMWPQITNGASANTQVNVGTADVYVIDFIDAFAKYAQFNFPLPSDFAVGGTLLARFLWTSVSADVGAVRWSIDSASLGDNDALGPAFGTTVYTLSANNGANKLNISAWSAAITPSSGSAPGDLCFVRVGRDGADAADTHVATARLLGVQMTYTRA